MKATYTLARVKDGTEVQNSSFQINEHTFNRSFATHTAKPEGKSDIKDAQFIVKKKKAK